MLADVGASAAGFFRKRVFFLACCLEIRLRSHWFGKEGWVAGLLVRRGGIGWLVCLFGVVLGGWFACLGGHWVAGLFARGGRWLAGLLVWVGGALGWWLVCLSLLVWFALLVWLALLAWLASAGPLMWPVHSQW